MTSYLKSIGSGLCSFAFVAATTDFVYAQATSPERGYDHFHGPGMMWGGGYMGSFGMFFGLLFFILLVIAIIAAAVFLMRSVGVAGIPHPPVRPNESENKALDILKERFAKGEIDAIEFDERKRLLSE